MVIKKINLIAGSIVFVGLNTLCLASTVTSVEFNGTGPQSEITVTSDGPVSFQKEEGGDNQVVLKLSGSLSKSSSRKIDTSSFESSPVKLISPYNVEGEKDSSKIVIQLRQAAAADVTQDGNVIHIKLPNTETATHADAVPPTAPNVAAEPAPTPAAAIPAPPAPEVAKDSVKDGGQKGVIDDFLKRQETHQFSGRPITLKVRDADLTDVFRLIGETSGFNIVMNENVKGKVTLSMEGVPWDQVLDVILRTHQLGAERAGNLLRIATLTDLTAEKTQELAAQKATEAIAPRVTKVFSINYANVDDLTKILKTFTDQGSAAAAGPAGAASGSQTLSIVQVDKRTNSIVVRDTLENVEKMKKLIEILDLQTPQVMIEAKIVEASESFSKSIGGSAGFFTQTGGSLGQMGAGFNGSVPANSQLLSSTNIFGTSASNGGLNSTIGFAPQLGFLGSASLNAIINMNEQENNAKVISSPKTVVLDHEQANILETTPVLVPTTVVTPGVGQQSTTTTQPANLGLTVTPSVTNENSVLLQLTVSRDLPAQAKGGGSTQYGIAQRNMTTKVLVDSGSTLVIGGVYEYSNDHSESGFPFLRKIPLIGHLFGNETDNNSKTELFFFITPRILNPREAGLGG